VPTGHLGAQQGGKVWTPTHQPTPPVNDGPVMPHEARGPTVIAALAAGDHFLGGVGPPRVPSTGLGPLSICLVLRPMKLLDTRAGRSNVCTA
jgi:hypothetical protein